MSDSELTPSLEDYLEAILRLERKNRVARVKDIALLMDVQMPSVTGALKILRSKELVSYEKNSFIVLTEHGLELARAVEGKHDLLAEFLVKVLLVPREKAQAEACEIEHVVGPSTSQRIKNLTVFLEKELFESGKISPQEWKKIIT